jgi:hypothetical protein
MSEPPPRRKPPARSPDFELFPVLDRTWPEDGLGPIATLVAQLPDPADLAEGALVVVREAGPRPRGFRRWVRLARDIWTKPRKAHAAVRGTALLARGYREIGATVEPRTGEEWVWGFAATSDRSFEEP